MFRVVFFSMVEFWSISLGEINDIEMYKIWSPYVKPQPYLKRNQDHVSKLMVFIILKRSLRKTRFLLQPCWQAAVDANACWFDWHETCLGVNSVRFVETGWSLRLLSEHDSKVKWLTPELDCRKLWDILCWFGLFLILWSGYMMLPTGFVCQECTPNLDKLISRRA